VWEKLAVKNAIITVFGEWAGPGIQKGVAVNSIPQKSFFIFAVCRRAVTSGKLRDIFVIDPKEIVTLVKPVTDELKNVYVLPWQTKPIDVNIEDSDDRERFATHISDEVDRVEKVDPYIKEVFGVTGIGEGLVMYAFPRKELFTRGAFDRSTFKAKGEKHRVVKQPKAVVVDAQQSSSANSFAEMFVTEARCEQGLSFIVGPNPEDIAKLVPSMTGKFMQWIIGDVKKESVAELEASGLSWKDVQKAVTNKASEYFKRKVSSV